MDLVTRLRSYIDHIAMPVTQFADTCGIPRPSMSQLLSGRNKKVSNELIAKIHDAFPELNVLWLMFGQGDMLISKNMQFSAAQNSGFEESITSQPQKNQYVAKSPLSFGTPLSDGGRKIDNVDADDFAEDSLQQQDLFSEPASSQPSESAKQPIPRISDGIGAARSIVQSADRSKRIVNIIVYYSDNSFEAFVPEQN